MFGSDSSEDEEPREVVYTSDHRQQPQHRSAGSGRGTGRGGGAGERRDDYSYVHHRDSRRFSRGGGGGSGGGSDVSGLEQEHPGELCSLLPFNNRFQLRNTLQIVHCVYFLF